MKGGESNKMPGLTRTQSSLSYLRQECIKVSVVFGISSATSLPVEGIEQEEEDVTNIGHPLQDDILRYARSNHHFKTDGGPNSRDY